MAQKHVISVCVSEETILRIREVLRQNTSFRNKSHLIEEAVNRMLESTDIR